MARMSIKSERGYPQQIKKQQVARKSPRRSLEHSPSIIRVKEGGASPLRASSTGNHGIELPRKRKREQERQEAGSSSPSIQPSSKRTRNEPSSWQAEKSHREGTRSPRECSLHPLEYWVRTRRWPEKYFEQDNDLEKGRPMQGFHHLRHLFARKRSSSSLRRKSSQSSLQTASDQLPREVKSAQYKDPEYEDTLEKHGSYMRKFQLDITSVSKGLCQSLLLSEQAVPRDSLFRDDLFEKTQHNLRTRNEAMVIRDIGLLIAPSAQTLALYGATHLNILYESVNEGWNSAIPIHGTRPQPDYSVGFGRSAFTEDQLEKLEPFIGELGAKVRTYFMATTRMYFPFFTCEIKCGAAALEVADRQNAHSMTVAVKGIVQLYRAVGREKELNREILAFSVSHDHTSVRIYGHYPVIEEESTTFYRHPIRKFDFTDGEEKWTAYKFTKSVYDEWMPLHHRRICSGIDGLPTDINFDSPSQQTNAEHTLGEDDSQGSLQEITPTTSFSQSVQRASKKPKSQRTTRGDE